MKESMEIATATMNMAKYFKVCRIRLRVLPFSIHCHSDAPAGSGVVYLLLCVIFILLPTAISREGVGWGERSAPTLWPLLLLERSCSVPRPRQASMRASAAEKAPAGPPTYQPTHQHSLRGRTAHLLREAGPLVQLLRALIEGEDAPGF